MDIIDKIPDQDVEDFGLSVFTTFTRFRAGFVRRPVLVMAG